MTRELRTDQGMIRALAAMYRQLRRAFRLAGSLGYLGAVQATGQLS